MPTNAVLFSKKKVKRPTDRDYAQDQNVSENAVLMEKVTKRKSCPPRQVLKAEQCGPTLKMRRRCFRISVKTTGRKRKESINLKKSLQTFSGH